MPTDDPAQYCPECLGQGHLYAEIDADRRFEQTCPACHGTGRASDALYDKLSGDAELRRQTARDEVRSLQQLWSRRIAHFR